MSSVANLSKSAKKNENAEYPLISIGHSHQVKKERSQRVYPYLERNYLTKEAASLLAEAAVDERDLRGFLAVPSLS